MNLMYVTIVVLASVVFVLSAMVGYLYWEHTNLNQNLQSLALVVSTLVTPPISPEPPVKEDLPTEDNDDDDEEDEEEDDRVSVEHVDAPPVSTEIPPTATTPSELDVDDLQSKTASQLRDMLSKKGIPFGKRDSKTTLIELLKATA